MTGVPRETLCATIALQSNASAGVLRWQRAKGRAGVPAIKCGRGTARESAAVNPEEDGEFRAGARARWAEDVQVEAVFREARRVRSL